MYRPADIISLVTKLPAPSSTLLQILIRSITVLRILNLQKFSIQQLPAMITPGCRIDPRPTEVLWLTMLYGPMMQSEPMVVALNIEANGAIKQPLPIWAAESIMAV
jgi:hypothetical protein